MQLLRRHPSRGALLAGLAGIAVLAASCTDRSDPVGPAGPGTGPGTPPVVAPPGTPVTLQALECTGDRVKKTVECGSQARGDFLPSYLIVGGQNLYVTLTSSNVDYDAATQLFSFNVTIRNRIPQPLGTADTTGALAQDPAGVRIFFHDGPNATGGAATVANPDGFETYTAANQPYFQYNTVLEQYEVSAPRTWQLSMPPTVTTFNFTLLVAAAVPYPDGYVDVMGNGDVRAGNQRQLAAVLRTVVGNPDTLSDARITWFAVDSTRAQVDSTGMVDGLRTGTTMIAVQTDEAAPRRGKMAMNVRRVRRVWTGAAGTTDWNTGANWKPANGIPDPTGKFNVVPEPTDTAVISDTITPPAANYPVLVENEVIGGVEVFQGSIALNAFNLTASGSVLTQNAGQITSSSGQLVLVGVAQTLRGTLPRINVTGTYTLDGNIVVDKRIRVQGGRLRNPLFRIRQLP